MLAQQQHLIALQEQVRLLAIHIGALHSILEMDLNLFREKLKRQILIEEAAEPILIANRQIEKMRQTLSAMEKEWAIVDPMQSGKTVTLLRRD